MLQCISIYRIYRVNYGRYQCTRWVSERGGESIYLTTRVYFLDFVA